MPMRALVDIDKDLLDKAKDVAGLPSTATADDILRRFVENAARRRALEALEGSGWDGPHDGRPTLEQLAKEFRALTAGRQHTPAEILMREGRDDR